MKKKWLALTIAGVLCFNLTGCSLGEKAENANSDYSVSDSLAEYKKAKEKNKEDEKEDEKPDMETEDYELSDNGNVYLTNEKIGKYTEIILSESKFMVPDSITETENRKDNIIRFMDEDETYDLKAQCCDKCFHNEDIDEVVYNIEKFYLDKYNVTVAINAEDSLSNTENKKHKYIFPTVNFSGYDGSIAYLCEPGNDVLLYIIEDGKAFTQNEKDIILKSLDSYDNDEYTAATDSGDDSFSSADEDFDYDTAPQTDADNPLFSYEMTVNGDTLKLPMWFSDLEEAGWVFEGDRDELVNANTENILEYWKKGDASIQTTLSNFSVNAAPNSECIITEIGYYSYDEDDKNNIELPLGIELNKSDYDEVLKTYGRTEEGFSFSDSKSLVYQLDTAHSVELSFDKESEVLIGVTMECQEQLEGVDSEIKDERPEILDTYKEPTELSEDLMDTTVELDGVVYQFPCPVEKFIENGWTMKKADELTVSPTQNENCKIVKGDMEIRLSLENPTQNVIYAKYCYAYGLDVITYDGLSYPITIGNNITIGDVLTVDEVIEKFEGMEISPYLDDESINMIFVDCSDDIEYCVTVVDGIVGGINMINSVDIK